MSSGSFGSLVIPRVRRRWWRVFIDDRINSTRGNIHGAFFFFFLSLTALARGFGRSTLARLTRVMVAGKGGGEDKEIRFFKVDGGACLHAVTKISFHKLVSLSWVDVEWDLIAACFYD